RLGGIWQRDDRDAPASIDVVGAALTPADPPANAASIGHGGALQRNLRLGEPIKRKSQVYSATLNYDAGFATITSITSLAKMNFERRKVFTYYNAAPGVTFGDVLAGAYGQPVDVRSDDFTTVRRINQEIRIASAPGSGAIDYLAGLFYTDEKSSLTQLFDVTSVATPPEILTLPVPGGGLYVPARYREMAGFA